MMDVIKDTQLPPAGTHLEYTSRVDCEAQGCNPKHGDDGAYYYTGDERANTLNGHAVEVFVRSVRYGEWSTTR